MSWLIASDNLCHKINDHGYVPFVVITIRSFLIDDLLQGL